MDFPKGKIHVGIDWAYGDDATAVFLVGEKGDLVLHSKYKTPADERAKFVASLAKRHKPDQIDILVEGTPVPLSRKTLDGLINGTITEDDLKI